jgi:hypothetical protein
VRQMGLKKEQALLLGNLPLAASPRGSRTNAEHAYIPTCSTPHRRALRHGGDMALALCLKCLEAKYLIADTSQRTFCRKSDRGQLTADCISNISLHTSAELGRF